MIHSENCIRLYDDRQFVKDLDIDVENTLERIIETYKDMLALVKEDIDNNDNIAAVLKTMVSMFST